MLGMAYCMRNNTFQFVSPRRFDLQAGEPDTGKFSRSLIENRNQKTDKYRTVNPALKTWGFSSKTKFFGGAAKVAFRGVAVATTQQSANFGIIIVNLEFVSILLILRQPALSRIPLLHTLAHDMRFNAISQS
jgi:hypothetical protein